MMSGCGMYSQSHSEKGENTLFVTVKGSKLPHYINSQHLRKHFEEFEDDIVNSMVCREKETMKSRGYGFIEFRSSFAASEAMRTLKGSLLRGKFPLLLKYKRKYSDSASSVYGSDSDNDADSASDSSNTTLYVGVYNSKFPNYVNSHHLRQHFAEFEHTIVNAMIVRDMKTKETKGYGFVKFSSHAAAKLAMKRLRGSKLHGKFKLFINLKEGKGSRSSTPSVSVSRSSSTFDLSSCYSYTDSEDDDTEEQSESDCTLYVSVYNSKFPNYINSRHLAAHFSEFDEHIKRAMIMRDMKTKESKGFGIVTFSSKSVAETAMKKLRGSKLNGKLSLYINIKKDEMKHSSKSSPAAEKSLVQLSGTTEELLYLRNCFYSFPTASSSALKESLPAQLILRDNVLFLFGTDNARRISTNQIHASRLIQNLLSCIFSGTWDPGFFIQLRDSIIPPINKSEADVLCILTNQQEQGPNLTSFTVQIFSHSLKILKESQEKLDELTPQSKLYQLRPEFNTVNGLTDAFRSLGKEHGTRIQKEAGTGVRIHGLKQDDIQNCWIVLKSFVDSMITVTHTINLGFWEIKYLQAKCNDFVHTLEVEGCKVQFPVLMDEELQNTEKSVVLIGKLKSTREASQRIKDLCSKCHVQLIKLNCNKKYLGLWLKQWEEFVAEHEKSSDVMIEFQQQPQSTVDQVIDFAIVGTNPTAVANIRNTIVQKQNGSKDKLSNLDVVLASLEFTVVSTNFEEFKANLNEKHGHLVVELDSKKNIVQLITTPNKASVLSMIEKELTSFVASKIPTLQKSITKEIKFKDEVIGSLLTSRTKHLAKLERQGGMLSVNVQPDQSQPEVFILRLSGNEVGIKVLESLIESDIKELTAQVNDAQLVLDGYYISITCMDSFKTFCLQLLKELHVSCVYHPPGGGSTLRHVLLKSKSGHLITLQIATGQLCDEKVDAIVIPAELCDKTMTNAEMNGEYFCFVKKKSLTTGEVSCIDSGTFPSRKALHVLLPKISVSTDDYVMACSKAINCASSHNFGSLSLPALGVDDVHKVPTTVCVETLLHCIDSHCLDRDETTLHTVRIVITHDLVSTFLSLFDKHTFKALHKVSSARGNKQLTPSPPQYEWYWEDDKKQFVQYSSTLSHLLTRAKMANQHKKYFRIDTKLYCIDLSTLTQRNLNTGFIRKVMCKEVPTCSSINDKFCVSGAQCTPKSKVQWYYRDDRRKFTAYTQTDSTEIEDMYQKVSPVSKNLHIIQSRLYRFDFENMKQENVLTKHQRDIKREEIPCRELCEGADSEAAEEATSQVSELPQCVVNLRGPIDNLESGKQMVEDKLKSLATSKNVPLPTTSTPALKQKLQSIARKHSVCSSIQDDDKPKTGASQRRFSQVIRIEGAEHLVDKAVTEVQGEIIEFHSQSSLAAVPHTGTQYPTEWVFQTSTSQLFDLDKQSVEWIRVTSLFKETMPNAEIHSVKRIQNKRLWERYSQQRDWTREKNNGSVNEKELWHGSRNSSADNIYASEEGFDMRYSSEGLWGQANYFAEKASYSDKYAFKSGNSTKELLLAKVLTGDSFESPQNPSLRMPPEKPKSSQSSNIQLKQLRYDSVNGTTLNCRVYMTYANDKAYPSYLVCYSPTNAYPLIQPAIQSRSAMLAFFSRKYGGFTQ